MGSQIIFLLIIIEVKHHNEYNRRNSLSRFILIFPQILKQDYISLIMMKANRMSTATIV